MQRTDAICGLPDPQHQLLLEIRYDPRIVRLARKRAGHIDLAEDALQTAYCRIAAMDLGRIGNLRGYFITVVQREVYALNRMGREVPFEDVDDAAQPNRLNRAGYGPAVSRSPDESVCNTIRDETWLKRLADRCHQLRAEIPARSDDPACYRDVVYAAARQVLCDSLNGEPSDADSNDALQVAYPEYFDQPAMVLNTLHQRFRRARADVQAVLRAVVGRDEILWLS